MQKYLINLTNQLIDQHRYDAVYAAAGCPRINSPEFGLFFHPLKLDIEIQFLARVSGATMGRIMCSLDTGDVLAQGSDFLREGAFPFTGDCRQLQMHITATCLAYAIYARLRGVNYVPAYRPGKRK